MYQRHPCTNARAEPENYDAGFVDRFLELIVKLEASAAQAERVRSTTPTEPVDETQWPTGRG